MARRSWAWLTWTRTRRRGTTIISKRRRRSRAHWSEVSTAPEDGTTSSSSTRRSAHSSRTAPTERATAVRQTRPERQTTLDDNITQAAMRLLMRVDRDLGFKDAPIHEAALFALDSLIKAQYPNGAWPQRFSRFPEPNALSGQAGELSRVVVADVARTELHRPLHLQRQLHRRHDRRDARGRPDL